MKEWTMTENFGTHALAVDRKGKLMSGFTGTIVLDHRVVKIVVENSDNSTIYGRIYITEVAARRAAELLKSEAEEKGFTVFPERRGFKTKWW